MTDSISPKSWRPTPLIGGSVVLNLAALVAVAVRPQAWPWALGAVVVNHLVLTAAGLWPRSALLGPNWTRLPRRPATRGAVAITIDDGPHPDITPQVLAILDAHGAKATFFCVGEKVQRHADLAREMVNRGHVIENHTQQHVHTFSLLGPRGLRKEIGRAQDSIGAIAGTRPVFFRAPAGLRNPFLDPVLNRLDLQLASWTRRGFDTVKANAAVVLAKLTRNLGEGDILLLHDSRPVILEVLPALLAAVAQANLRPITLRAALA